MRDDFGVCHGNAIEGLELLSCLSAEGLCPRFASLDALVPCVIEVKVTNTSAVSDPGTAATAATRFPGFRNNAAFGAGGTACRSGGCACEHVGIAGKNENENSKAITAWNGKR